MEDKIIASKGYCILVTDEGAGFFINSMVDSFVLVTVRSNSLKL